MINFCKQKNDCFKGLAFIVHEITTPRPICIAYRVNPPREKVCITA